ncbi:MAG: DUF3556 domain-containing protein [Polyangiaceae bacterium]
MRLPTPKAPPYDPEEWQRLPWSERMHLACQAWALDGYGAPLLTYGLYVVKVMAYVATWMFFCQFNRGIDELGDVRTWAFTPIAFQKAVLWSMAFEGLGLGCASGPLTGRYVPPVAAAWHFLKPGTIKMPLFPRLPFFGRTKRGYIEAATYAAHYVVLFHALCAPAITPELVLPTVILLPLLGVMDKTIFLAARGEHYFSMTVCFLFADDWLSGAMAVQLAIWIWAAVSKLTSHFPTVIGVMTSNSPVLRWQKLRRAMYRHFPDDLRPSRLASVMAHGGTLLEFSFPVLLVVGRGGALTMLGLGLMLLFHIYITSHFPMAVPIEWNVMVVYGGFFFFGAQATAIPLQIGSPVLLAYLALALVVVPATGNIAPKWVSFLLSMRYYAGNWAYSVWLFRGDSDTKLDEHIVKISPLPNDQLRRFYDEKTIAGLMSKIPAFRAMHLHGRALGLLLPRAVEDLDEYHYYDGEILAGVVIGYNFGDGHLHDGRLLQSIQAQCHFAPGELRHIFVESQPLFRRRLHWQIRDAAEGLLEEGHISVSTLLARQPYDGPAHP